MISNLKRYFSSKDAKILLENFISLTSLQIFGMLLPIITLPYILRVVGIDNYGTIILSASLIAYFQSLTDFSFRITATRDVSVFRNNISKLSIIYSRVVIIKSIFLFISVLIITGIIYIYPPFYQERLIFFLTMPMLIGYAIFPEWFFQGIEKMRYITYLNLGIKIFFTIGVFVFIKNENDFWKYPLLQSLGFLFAGVLGQYIVVKKYRLKFFWLKRRYIWQSIRSNTPVFINQFFPSLYNNTSTMLLGIFMGSTSVGIYDSIKKIVELSNVFLGLVSRVFFPFLNRRKQAFSKFRKLMLVITLFLTVMCIALNKAIFWYLNIDFEQALIVLTVLALGLIGITLNNIYGTNYFIIRRMDVLVRNNTVRVSIFGFIAAFPLIYYFGIVGAAVNLSLCRLLLGGGLYLKYLNLKIKD